MIQRITSDQHGIIYSAMIYEGGALPDLPWGKAMFDCMIFPPSGESSNLMESLIGVLPYEQIDWVHVAEPSSQKWHDAIDLASVRKGVQSAVGDGRPMTAWFEEVKSVDHWDRSHNLGACDNFLFIFTDSITPLPDRMSAIKRKLECQPAAGVLRHRNGEAQS